MFFDTRRPALIVGNGPSSLEINYLRIPKDVYIFRMNMFFLEDQYYFGRSVDGFFCSVRNNVIEDYLLYNQKSRQYDISIYFTPLKSEYETELLYGGECVVDHWEILSKVPEIAVEMIKRPLPTQGLQALASLLILGFCEIYVVGIDFYQNVGDRYSYQIPEPVKGNMLKKDYRPGYENGAHSFDKDIAFYKVVKRCFPDAKIFSLSEKSFFTTLAPIPDLQVVQNLYVLPKAETLSAWINCDRSKILKIIERVVVCFLSYVAKLRFIRKLLVWLKKQL